MSAKLATAQLAIPREYGFPSWRALKMEIDRRREPHIAEFMRACTAGDVDVLAELFKKEPGLARERVAAGSTGLHLAVRHPDALRFLLQHGADPNVRDEGDNASPLHFAAAHGNVESVRLLLDAGADVHGAGDLHHANVIGWAARKGNQPLWISCWRAARGTISFRQWPLATAVWSSDWSKRIPTASRDGARDMSVDRRLCTLRLLHPTALAF